MRHESRLTDNIEIAESGLGFGRVDLAHVGALVRSLEKIMYQCGRIASLKIGYFEILIGVILHLKWPSSNQFVLSSEVVLL